MTPEEMATEAGYRVESIIDDLVEKKMKSLADPKSDELADLVLKSSALSIAIHAHFDHHVATTVGNRLRCGCWDAGRMDKVFDSVWTEQLDKAIADRIRGKVHDAIDAIITDRLSNLKNRR